MRKRVKTKKITVTRTITTQTTTSESREEQKLLSWVGKPGTSKEAGAKKILCLLLYLWLALIDLPPLPYASELRSVIQEIIQLQADMADRIKVAHKLSA
jgi:hypothetical protein